MKTLPEQLPNDSQALRRHDFFSFRLLFYYNHFGVAPQAYTMIFKGTIDTAFVYRGGRGSRRTRAKEAQGGPGSRHRGRSVRTGGAAWFVRRLTMIFVILVLIWEGKIPPGGEEENVRS